ncbi:MAG TPA: M20/M25/M40 family metallo-hydrolase [Rhizomicrobium sp.]|nr:M20/M25/M40 family metallo-hydrolase [Rhizomicrobium sp.]
MSAGTFRGALRIWLPALLALGFWLIAKYGQAMPEILPASAPASEFSAMRADAALARILGPEKPHPAATAENAAVRARILKEFAVLGVKATTYTGFGCNAVRSFGVLGCGTVNDIIADVRPGAGKAIVLMAHYDSVPAGPGAADDASSVATILESVRALKARGDVSLHPIIALITDGEEYGLLGAAAFLDNAQLRARVGAVVNVEARGNRGPSLLFQTSPGDGRLIDLYAKSVRNYATSSLYAEIYRFLPNDTDLTLFIRQGFTSFNFAFVENVAHYHTPLDRRENISLVTLQQHGENLLGVAGALEQTDFAALKGGNDIYADVFGRALPRLPESWALPLSIAAFLVLALTAFLARGVQATWRQRIAAASMPLAAIVGTTVVGLLLRSAAQLIGATGDPSYAHPLAMRISLAAGVFAVVLAASRMASPRLSAISVWLWFAGLAVLTAAFLPGISPYFLFPSIAAAILLPWRAREGWNSTAGQALLLVAALPALVLWVSITANAEMLMGFSLPSLFTVPASFALLALIPLMNTKPLPMRGWSISLALAFGGAIGAAVAVGLQPAYSEMAPLRLNLAYVEDHDKGRALWAVDANAPLPPSLRAAAKFGKTAEKPYPAAWLKAYVADAGKPRFAAPAATVTQTARGKGRRVTLALQGSADAAQMYLVVPKAAQLEAITLNGKHFDAPPEWKKLDRVIIGCQTGDCRNANVMLDLATKKAVELMLAERRAGLPDFGKFLERGRPKTAVPSQLGDGTYVLSSVKVPGL